MADGAQSKIVRFPFDELPHSFPFALDDEPEILSQFSMTPEHYALEMPLGVREFEDAILGVVDPYTLENLDHFTLDLKMWPDMSGLVPSGHAGAGDLSIFAVTDPYFLFFMYRHKYFGIFELDSQFMGGYGWPLQALYMALHANSNQEKPALAFQKGVDGKDIYMYLDHRAVSLDLYIRLVCRSILGHEWTLGEMDPFALGELDDTPLWYYSEQAAAALRLITGSVDADVNQEPNLAPAEALLRIEGGGVLNRDATIFATNNSKCLSGLVSRRSALLGDIDDYMFDELDAHTLDMYFYGNIPAVVTAE